jgi:hypothetical protein
MVAAMSSGRRFMPQERRLPGGPLRDYVFCASLDYVFCASLDGIGILGSPSASFSQGIWWTV